MGFGFLADGKGTEVPAVLSGDHRGRNGDGIGAHSHPAHSFRPAVEHFENGLGHQPGTITVKRRLAGIQVPGGSDPRPQLERSIRSQRIVMKVLEKSLALARKISQVLPISSDTEGG
jgi:hypothetical protein